LALTKQAGTWTYEDLVAMPDDGRRYEIIEGELFEMPAPILDHARVIANLIAMLIPLVSKLSGQWFTAPVDVFFPGADPVQPDILVLLPGWQGTLARRGVEGAPDLLIEVVSPASRQHDLLTKRALYGLAGVREYWLVDPEARTVDVLTLDRDALHMLQAASGEEFVTSPILDGSTFPVPAIFAGVGENRD
jgi:Uma2 family endonuclease